MRTISLLILVSQLACILGSYDWTFSYSNHGYDFDKAIPPDGWKGVNRCGVPNNQSPINLMDPFGQFGYIYGKTIPAEADQLEVAYQDPSRESEMLFERNNFFMYVDRLPPGSPPSYFKSKVASLYYGFTEDIYYPESFHVHYTTEHFFNGKQFEISMHTNHYLSTSGNYDGSEMELFTHSFAFDSKHFDRTVSEEEQRVIDNFFDDLNLKTMANTTDIYTHGVRFREFMNLFDYSNRWTYLGGAAFPPCNQINFWQVLRTVYPIKPRHAELIKQTFAEKAAVMGASTNTRGIFPVNGHRVRFVAGQATRAIVSLSVLVGAILVILIG